MCAVIQAQGFKSLSLRHSKSGGVYIEGGCTWMDHLLLLIYSKRGIDLYIRPSSFIFNIFVLNFLAISPIISGFVLQQPPMISAPALRHTST